MADPDREGPGLTALQAHVDRIDGGPPSHHFFPRDPRRFQRGGPVHAVTAHNLGEPRHWHLVTYGLSELFEKESPDKDVSGWGFELSFRLARVDDEAPEWACDLLTNLAAYVWQSGHDFAHGDHVDLRGPIKLDHETAITAAALVTDPKLATVRGPFGRVEFLQVVGLTADELELCRAWRTDSVLELVAGAGANSLLVTDVDRSSVLDDPAVREQAEAGIGADGSSLDELRVGTLRLVEHGRRRKRVFVQMGAGAATGLGPALRRKLNRPGATFRVVGGPVQVTFVVAEPARWDVSGQAVEVDVPMSGVDELAGLFTGKAGSAELPGLPGLRFVVLA